MNQKNHIEDENENLKNVAPFFSDIKKQNCFEVPENYFESLSSSITNKCFLSTSKLSEIKKENPFHVSSDYFEMLPQAIQEKIIASKNGTSLSEKLIWITKPQYSVSLVAIITVITIGAFFIYFNNPKETQTELIASNEISLNDQLSGIDESLLIETLTNNENSQGDNYKEINNDRIVNYLIENNIDITTITDEL